MAECNKSGLSTINKIVQKCRDGLAVRSCVVLCDVGPALLLEDPSQVCGLSNGLEVVVEISGPVWEEAVRACTPARRESGRTSGRHVDDARSGKVGSKASEFE